MEAVDLARAQFAMTSIFHFLFVPVTIGLSFCVAWLQTRWHRTGDPDLKRLTRFFGTLLLINIAVGVVTGLVQEFQFGMNWSAYSRFVGDVFGAPLAMEGLAAFFLESTFLGLWLFGWGRLPARLHLATIWAVAVGTALSAAFIMAANSWMQNPVGYEIDSANGRAMLNDIGAVFTNPVFVMSYLHVMLASLVTGLAILFAASAWHVRRSGSAEFRRTLRGSMYVLAPVLVLTIIVGSELGVVVNKYQPMKIAAAEAQWDTCQPCSFSAFQIGGGKNDQSPTQLIEIPYLLSFLATNSPTGEVVGLNELNEQYQQEYGPGDYVPNVFIQYWSMRTMAYTASGLAAFALLGILLAWRGRLESSRWYLRLATLAVVTPFIMNTAGWMLTENGRQPWIVQGLMLTEDGVSVSVSAGEIWVSLVAFGLLYLVLTGLWVVLMLRWARKDLPPAKSDDEPESAEPALTY